MAAIAFQNLNSLSVETLQEHRDVVIDIIQRLSTAINYPLGQSERPTRQKQKQNARTTYNKVERVVKFLDGCREEMKTFFELEPEHAIGSLTCLHGTDPRILDLLFQGGSVNTGQARFRCILSQLSYAWDFLEWSASQPSKNASIASYLKGLQTKQEFSQTLYVGLSTGLKLIRITRLLAIIANPAEKDLLSSTRDSANVDLIRFSACAAVLSFVPKPSHAIRESDLGSLARTFDDLGWSTVVQRQSKWFMRCRELYEGEVIIDKVDLAYKTIARYSSNTNRNSSTPSPDSHEVQPQRCNTTGINLPLLNSNEDLPNCYQPQPGDLGPMFPQSEHAMYAEGTSFFDRANEYFMLPHEEFHSGFEENPILQSI